VDRAGRWIEEELRIEVVHLVGREHFEAVVSIEPEDPSRQEPGVPKEQAMGLIGSRVDIAATIAHDERASIQDADRVSAHRSVLPPPGAVRFSCGALQLFLLELGPSKARA